MATHPTWRTILAENVHHARTLRYLQIRFDPAKCSGVLECYEVCPVGCWAPDVENKRVQLVHGERCIACGACVTQCPSAAIELR